MKQAEVIQLFLNGIDIPNTTYNQAIELFLNSKFYTDKNEKDRKGIFKYHTKSIEADFKEEVYSPSINLSAPVNEPVAYEAKTIDLTNIDPTAFTPLPTNTPFDLIASKRKGLMKGTTYILTGESGAGKTTIAVNIGDYLREADPTKTVGFISGEMDEADWTEECLDNPRLATLPTIFLLNYLDAPNYMEVLTRALTEYDYVIMDSFEVIVDQLKEIFGWTAKKAETELITILRKAATSGTAIMAIQQYTKGGTFVGSNKIKHMLTGMIFVMFDKHGDRYVTFTKNRRGGHMVNKKLYFTKDKTSGRLVFDGERFNNDEAILLMAKEEGGKIEEESKVFDTLILEKAAEMAEKRKLLKDEGFVKQN